MITNGMTMKPAEPARILLETVNDGAIRTLKLTGTENERISNTEACRLYGRSQVDRLIEEGLFKPKGGRIFISPSGIDRESLGQIAASSNQGVYLPVTAR